MAIATKAVSKTVSDLATECTDRVNTCPALPASTLGSGFTTGGKATEFRTTF